MNLNHTKRILAGLASASLLLAAAAGADEKAAATPVEKPVTLESLPPAVQKTALEQSKGATVKAVIEEVSGDEIVYELEMKVGDLNKDIVIAKDGTLMVVEEQILPAKLPAAVKATFDKNLHGGEVLLYETVKKPTALAYYEAQVKHGEELSEIIVAPDGKLVPPEPVEKVKTEEEKGEHEKKKKG